MKNIAQREAAGLPIDEQNLRFNKYISSLQERSHSYLGHFRKYEEEVKKLEEEVKKLEKENLIKFLKKGESVWVKDENVQNIFIFNNQEHLQDFDDQEHLQDFDDQEHLQDFDDQERLKERLKEKYPEYADMLIHKANEVKKAIFLHNNEPLIDVLSEHYGRDFNSMTFNGIEAFFRKHKDDNIVDIFPNVGLPPNLNRSLGRFINLDVNEKHLLSLESRALATWIGENQKVSTPSTNVNTESV